MSGAQFPEEGAVFSFVWMACTGIPENWALTIIFEDVSDGFVTPVGIEKPFFCGRCILSLILRQRLEDCIPVAFISVSELFDELVDTWALSVILDE